MTAARLARAAERLVGTPFRLHGRDPATGLDCVGLFAAAMELSGRPVPVPTGYGLKVSGLEPWLPELATLQLAPATPPYRPGDVVLLQPGPAQFHLAIATRPSGWVHAHAGLRRVVCQPELPGGTIVAHWRIRPNRHKRS